ncbi:hypothetical protein ANN_14974 [Periplaneta americana]|uniref:Uncharacterized protein n=1 Tax=Periplaneta americana TaxID=6978 RepID=A0ABQ8SXR9_PERAM|nr:hypothetical protein ANN_14974 [Periplaneta americana]
MSPGSSTESYPTFARIGLRENPEKSTRSENIKTLEKIQKRAVKCCNNSPLKWDTLTDRRTRIRLCAMFETYRGGTGPSSLQPRPGNPVISISSDLALWLAATLVGTDEIVTPCEESCLNINIPFTDYRPTGGSAPNFVRMFDCMLTLTYLQHWMSDTHRSYQCFFSDGTCWNSVPPKDCSAFIMPVYVSFATSANTATLNLPLRRSNGYAYRSVAISSFLTENLVASRTLRSNFIHFKTFDPIPHRINDAINKLKEDIDSIVTWTKKFHLNINPGKTQAIILGHKRQTDAVKHLDISPVKRPRVALSSTSNRK